MEWPEQMERKKGKKRGNIEAGAITAELDDTVGESGHETHTYDE